MGPVKWVRHTKTRNKIERKIGLKSWIEKLDCKVGL